MEQDGAQLVKHLIGARDVGKKYVVGRDTTWVLRHLDFEVSPGEMVCLWGPSGSGKTTLLTILAGLENPSEGRVTLLDQPLHGLSEAQIAALRMRAIGFVFQFFYLMPNLTVLENIGLPLVASGRARDALSNAKILADEFGLRDRANHFPRQLSGGEQQRVALARAIIANPPIIMADEPTGNLDATSAGVVLSHLRSLADQGRAVVVASHSTRVAEMSDRILSLESSAGAVSV